DSPAAQVLYTQRSTTWRMPAPYYTYRAGPVQFFALDTNTLQTAEKQLQWLDEALAASRAPWKIVYGHHPIYTSGAYEDGPVLIAKLLPLLRHRADVYVAGHDHNMQALQPEAGVHFFVSGGGGAALYNVQPDTRTVFASRTNGFTVLEATATRLT